MRRLNASDDRWLATDSPENPFQIAGLLLFRTGADHRADDFERAVRAHLRERLPFTTLAVRHVGAPFGIEPGVWVGVDDLDLDRQVVRWSSDAPLTRADLHRVVADEVMRRWDPALAPFRCIVFDRLDDDVAGPGSAEPGAVGLFVQTHHSLVDGIGFQHTIEDLTDPVEGSPPQRSAVSGRRERPPNPAVWMAGALGRSAAGRRAWRRGATDREQAAAGLEDMKSDPTSRRARTPAIPGIVVDRYEQRIYERMEIDLPALKAAAKRLGGTVNDAMMTVVSGALRRLLDERGALADLPGPLVALVPRSVRVDGDGRYGNHFTMILPQLATTIADPVERFAAIRATMRTELLRNDLSQRMAPAGERLFEARRRRTQTPAATAPAGNVSISNVPGPATLRHLAGYVMRSNHPGPNLVAGQLVNITMRRYVESLDVGMMTDRGVLGDLSAFVAHVAASLDEVLAAGAQ